MANKVVTRGCFDAAWPVKFAAHSVLLLVTSLKLAGLSYERQSSINVVPRSELLTTSAMGTQRPIRASSLSVQLLPRSINLSNDIFVFYIGCLTMATRRYRSSVACESCRRRKVRCSVTVTGVPCAGCIQDGSTCTVTKGKDRV